MKKTIFFLLLVLFTTNVNTQYKKLFEGKKILITGGTGYLGRQLTSIILSYNPQKIIIFSRDEVKHYKFENDFPDLSKIENVIGNIRDYPQINKNTKNVDIVIHTAALKRIDMLESNVEESVKTNIIGTINIHRACLENNVKKAVLISTDKACSPINTYGACKFISEKIFTNKFYDNGTIFTVVRYGNVLDSTGSIIPILLDRIQQGKSIHLTHPDMTRFIINKKEAVDLIFKAIKYGTAGETFIPILPSFKIIDLMKVLRENLNKMLPIKTVGIRPGEKIHEALLNASEISRTYKAQNAYVIQPYFKSLPQDHAKFSKSSQAKDYSSENSIISKDEIEKILKNNNIL